MKFRKSLCVLILALFEWDLFTGFLRLYLWQCAVLLGLALLLPISWLTSGRSAPPGRPLLTVATILCLLLAGLCSSASRQGTSRSSLRVHAPFLRTRVKAI